MATASNNDIAKALFLTLEDKDGSALSVALKNAVSFLQRKRHLSRSEDILTRLSLLEREKKGELEVNIKSTRTLREEDKKYLREILKKRYGDKKFIFLEVLDEKMIGGVRIKIGDELIDLSLKNKIQKLQEHLTRNQ
ncbi:MAG: ATP synthase F1 subunit delta [Candidatus Paceibacterota bacterium]